jgi:hypothetical protein
LVTAAEVPSSKSSRTVSGRAGTADLGKGVPGLGWGAVGEFDERGGLFEGPGAAARPCNAETPSYRLLGWRSPEGETIRGWVN